jgi:HAD superfamily hydrolase (TIGR01509 family)
VIGPPFVPEAVVFDLDGLLVDSEPRWAEAEREVVTSFGRAWTPAIQKLLLGRGPADAARTLAEHLGEDDVAEVARRLAAAAIEAFRRGVDVRPSAAELVAGLHGHVPVGVATNSVRALADLALSSTNLAGLVGVVVTADDVERPKPAPDPYLLACARLGADPARSVAIEDSPLGIASARAAGLWVVGCPSLPGADARRAHAVVEHLGEVDPGVLRSADLPSA